MNTRRIIIAVLRECSEYCRASVPVVRVLLFGIALAVNHACAEGVFPPSTVIPALWNESEHFEQRQYGDLLISGHFRQGGLLYGQLASDSEISRVNTESGAELVVAGSDFILGLDRDAVGLLYLKAIGPGEEQQALSIAIAPRDYNIQRIEGVEQKYVAPDPEQVALSRRESARVSVARRQYLPRRDWHQGFIWPARGPLTGVFGSQRVYNGEPRRPHYGVDIAGPVGEAVYSPAAGVVTLAERDMFFSGGTLIVDHGYGLSSTLMHLSDIFVVEGQEVTQGETVAAMGASGRVTGPHLDWRMNWTFAGKSVRIDPQLLVSGLPLKRERPQEEQVD